MLWDVSTDAPMTEKEWRKRMCGRTDSAGISTFYGASETRGLEGHVSSPLTLPSTNRQEVSMSSFEKCDRVSHR